jgi:hypothetical protein
MLILCAEWRLQRSAMHVLDELRLHVMAFHKKRAACQCFRTITLYSVLQSLCEIAFKKWPGRIAE